MLFKLYKVTNMDVLFNFVQQVFVKSDKII